MLLFSQNITITHGPYLQKVGEEEVTVIWTTDKDAVSWVELAPAGNDSFYSQERPRYYDTVYGNKVVGKLHRVTITGLTPGTEYRYRCRPVVQRDFAQRYQTAPPVSYTHLNVNPHV